MNLRQATVTRIVLSSILVVAVATAGVILVWRIADFQRDQYFELRKFQVAAAAAPIDYRDVEKLNGDESDVDTSAFEKLRSQLTRIKETDSRIRFVYLMRPQDGQMIFLVDAEEEDSEDYSPPGQVYYEAVPEDFDPFEGKVLPEPEIEGPVTDRWGTWISASAYILDDTGKPVALLGTDVDIDRALSSFNEIRLIGFIFAGLLTLLLALVLTLWVVWRRRRDEREQIRLMMEESIVRLNAQLLESDKKKAEFIQSASHEFRGPITAVYGALRMLEARLGEQYGETGQRLIDIAKSGTVRIVELADNLLDMSRLESGAVRAHPEDVDLGKEARETVEVFEVLAREKGLDVQVELEGDEPAARLDPQIYKRVLENLLSNAIKYTQEGGITVRIDRKADSVLVSVADTGRGIPEDFRKTIFEKFARHHQDDRPDERGAGLGLAICKGLLEAHGGRIWFESEKGKGTTFYFEIPLANGDGSGGG